MKKSFVPSMEDFSEASSLLYHAGANGKYINPEDNKKAIRLARQLEKQYGWSKCFKNSPIVFNKRK